MDVLHKKNLVMSKQNFEDRESERLVKQYSDIKEGLWFLKNRFKDMETDNQLYPISKGIQDKINVIKRTLNSLEEVAAIVAEEVQQERERAEIK